MAMNYVSISIFDQCTFNKSNFYIVINNNFVINDKS